MAAEVAGTLPVKELPKDTPTAPTEPTGPIDLRLDMREHILKASITAPFTVAALPVADVWIGCSGEHIAPAGILLERKTVTDFEASLKDSRYREQKARMLAYAQERQAKVAYVIEGDLSRSTIGSKALQKLIARNEFIYGIPVFRVKNAQETAILVELLLEMWRAGDFTTDGAAGRVQAATYGIHVVKKENNADPRTHSLNVLCQCPGVSARTAEAWLAAHGGNLRAVLDAPAADLAEVRVGTRRVGPAVAARFKELWKNP
jgi:ERCC4-type nuclease